MSKHTPGPWEIEYRNDIGDSEEECFVEWIQTGPARIDYNTNYGLNKLAIENAYADAKLISAAPELLDALIELLRVATMQHLTSGKYTADEYFKATNAANDAIKKAIE